MGIHRPATQGTHNHMQLLHPDISNDSLLINAQAEAKATLPPPSSKSVPAVTAKLASTHVTPPPPASEAKLAAFTAQLESGGFDDEDAPRLYVVNKRPAAVFTVLRTLLTLHRVDSARGLWSQGIKTLELLSHASEAHLKDAGFNPGNLIQLKIMLSRAPSPSSGPSPTPKSKQFFAFASYCKKDTLAETALVFDAAKLKFPGKEIFRDTDQHFGLSSLQAKVRDSSNVLVFLSPGYASSPYCVVELVTAYESGARISNILVHKPGLAMFNFEAMNALLAQADVSSLLDSKGWEVVLGQGLTKERVRAALKAVMNIKAFPLHIDASARSRAAELEDIWDGLAT